MLLGSAWVVVATLVAVASGHTAVVVPSISVLMVPCPLLSLQVQEA